jgi:hypothetical protein
MCTHAWPACTHPQAVTGDAQKCMACMHATSHPSGRCRNSRVLLSPCSAALSASSTPCMRRMPAAQHCQPVAPMHERMRGRLALCAALVAMSRAAAVVLSGLQDCLCRLACSERERERGREKERERARERETERQREREAKRPTGLRIRAVGVSVAANLAAFDPWLRQINNQHLTSCLCAADTPLPAGHRAEVDGHCLWWLQEPPRRARPGGEVHGRRHTAGSLCDA